VISPVARRRPREATRAHHDHQRLPAAVLWLAPWKPTITVYWRSCTGPSDGSSHPGTTTKVLVRSQHGSQYATNPSEWSVQ